MPNDSKGIKMIYPNSKTNPQSLYYNGSFNSQILMKQSTNQAIHNDNGVLWFEVGNADGSLDFLTSSKYNSARVRPPDHSRFQTQKYMQDAKDWKNVECTVYVKVKESDSRSFIIWRARSGNDRKVSGDCETCGYEGQLLPNGNVRAIKRYYANATFFRDYETATTDIEERWVGFKFIVYNKGTSVVLEIWIDEDDNNNWTKALSTNDNKDWGSGGDHCSATDNSEQISWGGPIVTLNWVMADTEASIWFQDMSVREIDAGTEFEDDNTSGNDDDGHGSGSGSGSGTGGGGGQADKYGVKSRYATGKITYDYDENFRSDGKRWDFDVGGDEYVSCELRGYFKSSSDIGDDVSGKLGGGNHSDGTHPKCYVPDLSTDDGGNVRLRYEEDHPSTPTLQDGAGDGTDNGKGITGAFVGFCFVKRNLDNGNVLIQVWQDQGDNEGDEPANEWILVGSWEDDELQWTQPPNDHAETLRIDNDSGHNLEWKWIALQEISDSDSDEPGQGGGGSDTDGDGDVDDDDDDGGGSGDGGTGDGTGGTGSGPSTPPAPQAPPREVYQTAYLELMWNINYISGDPCNVNAPPEGIPPQELFSSTGDDSYINLPRDLMTGGWFVNKGSVMIGKKLRQVIITMKKENAPTGPIVLRIYDKTNAVVDEFDTTIDAAVLDGNDTQYTFDREAPIRELKEFDRISVDFWGADTVGDTINYIRVKISENDKVDSTASCLFVSDDNKNIEVNENLDLDGKVSI